MPTTPAPPEPVLELPPPQPRGPSVLLVAGFFVAAVAGVLGTWTIVKPAAPTKLVFHVESNPVGASVVVEGKTLGVTPIDLEQLLGQGNRASLELRLEKEGYAPANVRLTGGGGRLEVSQTLTPLPPAPKPEVIAPKPEPVVARPENKPETKPEPKPEPPPVPVPVKKPAKQVATPKPEPKRKPAPAPVVAPTAPAPIAPRPASKLDEEDEGGPAKRELKRATAEP